MRRTLRQMMDSGQLDAASPMAKSVAEHVQDPVGATKKGFEDMTKKRLEYEISRENMKRTLLPAKAILEHVDQMHELSGPRPTMSSNPDEQMGYTEDPNNPNVEPGSMGPRPLPGMNQKPGMMQPGNPQNARFAPGASPRIPGGKPGGAATGSQRQVGPAKMGVPQPGQGKPASVAGRPSTKPAAATGKGPGAAGKSPKVKVEVNSASTPFSYKFGKRPKGLRTMENAMAHMKLFEKK